MIEIYIYSYSNLGQVENEFISFNSLYLREKQYDNVLKATT